MKVKDNSGYGDARPRESEEGGREEGREVPKTNHKRERLSMA